MNVCLRTKRNFIYVDDNLSRSLSFRSYSWGTTFEPSRLSPLSGPSSIATLWVAGGSRRIRRHKKQGRHDISNLFLCHIVQLLSSLCRSFILLHESSQTRSMSGKKLGSFQKHDLDRVRNTWERPTRYGELVGSNGVDLRHQCRKSPLVSLIFPLKIRMCHTLIEIFTWKKGLFSCRSVLRTLKTQPVYPLTSTDGPHAVTETYVKN